MNFRTLLNKTADAIKQHLTQPTMVFTNKEEQTGVIQHIVREDDVLRPDLIALEYYNDHTKTDIILKFNGISDPFSLQEGDVLDIPSSGIAFHKLERPEGMQEDNPIKNQFLQDKRLPKKDDRRLDALKKKYNKDVLLPPNVIPLGKKNFKFDKGLVTFGAQAQNAEVNDPVVQEVLDDFVDVTAEPITEVVPDSPVGTGGGRGELTETQLDKLLASGVGAGKTSSDSGAGSGLSATETATNKGSGDAPQSTNDATGVSNDGAPCK